MKNLYVFSIFSLIALSGKSPDQFPAAEISNGIIHAKLYLPDSVNGYYRGVRFDWSGVMPSLEYKGHTYFGQWFERYSPTLHDAIMGPVQDFAPIGYDEAKPGESFLKIGIGMVKKLDDKPYNIVPYFNPVNLGKWKVKKKPDQVEFQQELNDKDYSYRYTKTVQLLKGKPEMVLSHSLKNTGKKAIETDVYDHNFFVLDQQTTSKDFTIGFPFNLSGEPVQGAGITGTIDKNKIVFLKEFARTDHLHYSPLVGYGETKKDYDIRIENHKTGAAVHITGDRPLSKLVFWCAAKTVCPEPYIHIKIKPGEAFSWKIAYQFYICATTN